MNYFLLINCIAVVSSQQQQPFVVGLDAFSTVISILALIFSLIISVSVSLITFTWKAAQLKARIEVKDLTLKGSITELQRDKIALSRQLDDDNRQLTRKTGNLDARIRAVENHLVKHMSFVPKEVRAGDN